MRFTLAVSASICAMLVLLCFTIAAAQTSEGPNLVPNPTLEIQNSSNMNMPQSWNIGGFGTNAFAATYPATPAHDGTKSASITISAYTSGDRKWFFNEVPVSPGSVLRYSDYRIANIPTWATAQFHMTDGSFTWLDLASPLASTNMTTWKNVGRFFVVPPNVQAVTVFPLLNAVGTLTIDTIELHVENVTPLGLQPLQPGNEVQNPSFEEASGSAPASWTMNMHACSTCKATFSYPAPGIDGPNAAQVTVSDYGLPQGANFEGFGWKSATMSVVGGTTYAVSDDYISNAQSFVTLEIDSRNSDGSVSTTSQDVGNAMPGASAQGFSATFTFPTNAVGARILHHLKGLGSLTIDAVSFAPTSGSNPSQFAEGMLSFDFDDCNEDQINNALPILQNAGFAGTFYVITHRLDQSGFFTTSQTLSLANAGNEIGNHTQTHPDLTTVSAAQLQAETAGAEQDFANIGLHPTTFAYPFGAYNAAVIQAVKNIPGMTGARSTNDGPVSRTDDHFTLNRMNLGSTTALSDVQSAVDSAIANKQWLILVMHHIVPNPSDNFSISPGFLQSVVNYVQQKGIKVVTNAQGISVMAPQQ